jgi:hypothetical protein
LQRALLVAHAHVALFTSGSLSTKIHQFHVHSCTREGGGLNGQVHRLHDAVRDTKKCANRFRWQQPFSYTQLWHKTKINGLFTRG